MADTMEREDRKTWAGEENEAFLLNEGVCPDCMGDVKIVSMGGIKRFHEDYAMNYIFEDDEEKPVFNHWHEDASLDYQIIGGIQWKCEDGHRHYVEVSKSGDWLI